MRVLIAGCIAMILSGWLPTASQAVERPLSDLPKDVVNLATVWTEPLKSVVEESRRFDPISGLWFGLLKGTIKSVERTVEFFIPRESESSAQRPGSGKILEYQF